jgi:multidrug efflux system membrane fusion protein
MVSPRRGTRGLALLALAALAGCSPPPPVVVAPPRAVSAATAVARDVPRYIDALGQTTAYEAVKIVAQVEGQIVEMPFKQGSLVKKNDVLAVIYQAPFQSMVDQVSGQLAADQATLKLAQSQVDRSKPLLSGNLVSQQQFDGYQSLVDQLKGRVQVDIAQQQMAQINLDYTTIKAPVDGMVGTYKINVGNVVKVNDAPITTIERMDPIYVDFVVSVADFPQVKKYYLLNDGQLPVHVESLSGAGTGRDGNLTILDNAIAQGTGTAALRATLPNADLKFWPNEPVRVRIFLETVKQAVLIPSAAVQLSQQGQFVFVITPGKAGSPPTVQKRSIQTGQLQDDGEVVITSGLSGGEQVVVTGQIFLLPDAAVQVADLDGKPTAAGGPAPQK